MIDYFPKPKSLRANVNVELDLSNCATKADLRNATGVDTLDFAKKTDLANLKSEVDKLDSDKLKNVPSGLNSLKSKVDKLDVDKLVPVPVNLNKLSDAVKNNVVEKDVCNAKIKNIENKMPDFINLDTNTTLSVKINEDKNKILSIINLTTNASLNAKINDAEGEIPSITNLAAIAALTTVENKTPNVCDLVKKADYDVEIKDIKKNISLHLIILSSRIIYLMKK